MKNKYIRNIRRLVAFFVLVLALAGCEKKDTAEDDVATTTEDDVATTDEDEIQQNEQADTKIDYTSIDVDLTILSSTMVYSEVYNMMVTPDDYIGKVVKMAGPFAVYQNPDNGNLYYACIIQDATACCTQGLEFVLAGEYNFPEDYPEIGTDITVTGVFETYEEDGYQYCTLKDAVMY